MPHAEDSSPLPLFPLGTVLFPGGWLPLRVFEVRYLDMAGKCHRAGRPFGVVALTQGSEVRRPDETESFHSVGTLASIESLEAVQPGLLMLRCIGTKRFRIGERRQLPHGLWTATAQLIADDQAVAVPPDLRSASDSLSRVLETLRRRDNADQLLPLREPLRLSDCGWVANRWCELLPLPLATKQRLMELDNPLVRLELVSDFLSRAGIPPSA